MNEVKIDKKRLDELKQKASFLEELLEVIEDRYLGKLMRKTEKSENIPLVKARKRLK